MKVYDCFTFYNELELLELRLKSLWDVVDVFVLVEANRKHNNQPKPFIFEQHKSEFAEFLPKIRHLMQLVDVDYKGTGDWSIENAQRNAIEPMLFDAEPDDYILISDADEIVAPDVFERIKNNQVTLTSNYTLPLPPPSFRNQKINVPCILPVRASELLEFSPIVMAQTYCEYHLNWVSKATWQGTVLTRRKNLTTPQALRDVKAEFPRVVNGGWHFSYMGGADRVIDKMNSIVDGHEMVVRSGGAVTDRKHVEETMAKGKDLYNRRGHPEEQLLPYDVKNIKLPYLDEFLKKYPHFLKEASE